MKTETEIMTTEPQTSAPTPRSDAAEIDLSHFADEGYGPSGYVHIDDMRKLERESGELRAALERAAIRFELIAAGCSPETASPVTGAAEVRAAIERAKGAE